MIIVYKDDCMFYSWWKPNLISFFFRSCDACVQDASCGFCFEPTSSGVNGACLPTTPSSFMQSDYGTCNSSTAILNSSFTWAYDYCPVSFSWIAIIGLALFLVFYAQSMDILFLSSFYNYLLKRKMNCFQILFLIKCALFLMTLIVTIYNVI